MELDVHLERTNEELWGFDIAGNPEQNLPLTVIKISPESPAERAGLKCDDVIVSIGEAVVADLTHEEALQAIDAGKDGLLLRVTRGLYDPVVEDPEAPFERYEQPDLDHPSEPTEVFKLEQFAPSPAPTLDPTRPDSLRTSSVGPESRGPTPFVPTPLEFDRSSTASPYKFRPFSTEPLPDIPPLEDPILLNPSYQDKFPRSVEDEDIPIEAKFKLPVSEQYDPEGKKQKGEKKNDIIERKVIKEISDDILNRINEKEKKEKEMRMRKEKTNKKVKQIKSKEVKTEGQNTLSILEISKDEKAKQESKKFMEEVLHEIEIKKMEEVALNDVEDSIQKAVSVTGQITKEVFEETTINTSKIEEIIEKETDSKDVIEKDETYGVKELVDEEKTFSKGASKIKETKDIKESIGNEENLSKQPLDRKDTKDFKECININEQATNEDIKNKVPIVTFVEEQVHESYEKKIREEKIYPSVLEDIQEEKEEVMSDEFKEQEIIVEEAVEKQENIIAEATATEAEKIIREEVDGDKQDKIMHILKDQEESYKQDDTSENIKENEAKVGQKQNGHKINEIDFIEGHKKTMKEEVIEESDNNQEMYENCDIKETTTLLRDIKEEKDTTVPIETKEELKTVEVKEKNKSENYEKKIIEEKDTDSEQETQEEKDLITRKDTNSKSELSLQETEEFEIIETIIEDPAIVKKQQTIESYEKEENISDAAKEIKKTTTDNSKMERVGKKEIKEYIPDKLPQSQTTKSFDKKSYESVNIRKESIVETNQNPEPAQSTIYQESKEANETVYKSERRLSGDFKSEAERRVYTLGLQTIPNIKGVVHSSHFNLLLKTFFIHLTDVMVALSRFILTEPAFSKLEDRENVERSTMERTIRIKQDKRDREVIEDRIQKEVDRRVEQKLKEEAYEREEIKRAEMRVAEERQKKELEQKRQQEMQRMKEVVKEELREEKIIESETQQEARSFKTTKNMPGKQTYKAVVEAHVYTNPDVVFEDYSHEVNDIGIEEIEMQRREKDRFEIIRREEEKRLETQKREQELITMQRREQERREQERLETQQREQEIMEMQRRDQQQREQEEMEMHKREQQRREQERMENFKREQHRREQERMEMQKREQQRREQERMAMLRREEERMEIQRREQQRRQQERMEMQRREQERLEMQRREQERMEIQRREQKRLEIQRREQQKMEMQRMERERVEMKRREEQMLEMRRREKITKSFEKQQYSRSEILHEAVQKVEEFIENKRLLEEAIMLQQSNYTTVQFKPQVIKPAPQTYKAIVAPQQRSNFREKKLVKTAAQRTEIDTSFHKTFDVKNHTERIVKPKFVQEKSVQVASVAPNEQVSGIKINKREAVEVIKSLVDQKAALEVLQVDTTRNELRELQAKKQKIYDASKSIIEQRGAVQVTQIEPMRNELSKLEIKNQKTVDASRSIIEQTGAIKVATIESTRNLVSDLKITKQKAKEVIQSLVDQKAALEVLQVEPTKNEVSKFEIKKQKNVDASRSIVEQRGAIQVSAVELRKDEIVELKTTKQKAVDASKKIIQHTGALQVAEVKSTKHEIKDLQIPAPKPLEVSHTFIEQTAIQVSEVKSNKDEVSKLKITKEKAVDATKKIIEQRAALQVAEVKSTKHDIKDLQVPTPKPLEVSQSLVEQNAIQVSEVKATKDEISELAITKEKAVDASKNIIEQRAALQVAEVKSTKHEIKDLQVPTPKSVEVSQSLVEQTAIQVSEVKATKDEISELAITKEKAVDASKNIIEQRAALQVAEVKSTKHEIKDLQVPTPKSVEVSQSLVEQTAIQVSEVKATKDEVSELAITKEKAVDASKNIIEQRAALQVAEVKHEIKDLQVPTPKSVEVSQSLVEQTAIQVSEVKSTKDEISELEITKEKAVDASKKIIEQSAALQVAEVKSTKHEIKDLLVVTPTPIAVSQSLIEHTAIQVSEVKSTKDEIEELEITKQKAVDVSETLIEQTAALQISEVELTKDEINELNITKEKAVDASKTIIEQDSALQIEEIEASKEEIEELEITKPKAAEISQSFIEQTAALQVAKVESTQDDVSDLQITKEKTVDVSQSIIEQRAALEVMKVEAEVDELSQLEVAEMKGVDVKASLAETKSTAVIIEEVESIKDDLSDLKVLEKREELAKSSEVMVKMDKAMVGKKVPTILDEFAELKVVKCDVQEPEESIHITDERDSAVQITEVSFESDREVKELAISQQSVHISNSSEIDETRAAVISQQKIQLVKALEVEEKQDISEFKVQASKDESASLKMIKHQVLEVDKAEQMSVESEETFSSKEIHQSNGMLQHSMIQDASFTSKLAETQEIIQSEASSENSEPSTPSTIPTTPLTDEYVFRLDIPLPKSRGTTPVPPEFHVVKKEVVNGEDPHIVKKGLVPYIEAFIEAPIIYDPPLPTPPTSPESKFCPFRYVKPGLKGGYEHPRFRREEIREMKRKSSLLASAIDETIKSIEEYKEEVGIESKKHTKDETHETKIKTIEQTTVIENGDIKEVKLEFEEVTENEEPVMVSGEKEEVNNGDSLKAEESKDVLENIIKEENIPIIQEQNGEIEEDKPSQEDSEPTEMTEIHEEVIEVNKSKEIKSLSEAKPKDIITVVKTETIEVKTEVKDSDKMDTKVEEVEKDDTDKEVENIAKKVETVENVDKKTTKVEQEAKTKTSTEEKIESEKRPGSVEIPKTEFAKKLVKDDENVDYLKLIKPVKFDPEAARSQRSTPVPPVQEPETTDGRDSKMYLTETGEPLGTIQGIVDGLEEAVVDEEVAKALGKPGLPHEKVAEIASGEADMLREAHVMGLSRVLTSHMHRPDDDSPEIQPLKPLVKSLESSEVLRALNEELAMEEMKKKEAKRWSTFLQKPKRPVPRAKFGYYGYIESEEEEIEEPYKVKIVKQPKPKVAPDFKPEDFDTGPLPWEERAEIEASLPPIEPEEPILVPEEGPEFLEAIDPLPESEVPDLEDTGLPLPVLEPSPIPEIQLQEEVLPQEEILPQEAVQVPPLEQAVAEPVNDAMDENKLAEQLTRSVQSMVDPNAPLEQQLSQMRAQLAALAQLPGVIQQTLDLVTRQLLNFSYQGMQEMQQMQQMQMTEQQMETQSYEQYEESQIQQQIETQQEEHTIVNQQSQENVEVQEFEQNGVYQEEVQQPEKILSPEEYEALRREEEARLEEERKSEKQRKDLMQQYENESRRSQMSSPHPKRPKPKFGPLDPEERRKVVPAGRKWRTYDEQAIAETIQAQSELIQGKVLGINFMKYQKPEPTLDHLKNSEVYKVVHDMDETPLKRVELLTPVIAESDYRKRCRSRTPSSRLEERTAFPQQLYP